jgi:hypothetical protein
VVVVVAVGVGEALEALQHLVALLRQGKVILVAQIMVAHRIEAAAVAVLVQRVRQAVT